jgi:hypothetical protein
MINSLDKCIIHIKKDYGRTTGSVNLRINLNPYLTVKQQYLHARERLVCNNSKRTYSQDNQENG